MTEKNGPIFILGFPRSGTTALARALGHVDGIQDFSAEGHYLYFIAELLEQLRKGNGVNPASLILNNDRFASFEREIAAAVLRFNEAIVAPCRIWVDKTPDLRQVQSVPVYARLFEGARFIFMYRSPIEAVESNVINWPEIRGRVVETATRWVETMSTWRRVREELPTEAYIEIFQEDMKRDPNTVMSTVGQFLGLKESEPEKLAIFLKQHQVNTKRKNKTSSVAQLSWLERKRVNSIVASELGYWPELKEVA